MKKNDNMIEMGQFCGNLRFPCLSPSVFGHITDAYLATAYAFAQIGSLRSPTSHTRQTLSEITVVKLGRRGI